MQTSTQLNLPPDQAIALFFEEARHHGLPAEREGNTLKVTSPYGDIVVRDNSTGVLLTVNAPDRAKLYVLQETIDHTLGEIGAAEGLRWSSAPTGEMPGNMSLANICSVERLSPSYFRIRLTGPDLERFARDGLHFRLLLGPSDRSGEWPSIAETGRTNWPGGVKNWHRPVYTVRSTDPDAGALEFDVFIHDGGRVTEWCKSAQPGDQVALMGPGGEWYPASPWLALFGDETALPAIARILKAAPAETAGTAIVLVSDKDDIQSLAAPAGVAIRWILRNSGDTLLEALGDLEIPETGRFVWFAGEQSEVAAARKILAARGLDKQEWRATAYWSR